MPSNQKNASTAFEIDRLAVQLAKDPHSKVFLPLAEEYCKAGMWQEAAGVLEDGLKYYPGFITAMVVLGRAYDQLGQPVKAKAILEEAVKLSPENLRAHRTLIKIYSSQGLTEPALQSCDAILALNPRDEEALSVQAKLGRIGKDGTETAKKREQVIPLKTIPSEPSSVEPVQEIQSLQTLQESGDSSASVGRERAESASPLARASTIMKSLLQADDHKSVEQTASADGVSESLLSAPTPPPHAETIAQLESWLRSIERNRCKATPSEDTTSSTS